MFDFDGKWFWMFLVSLVIIYVFLNYFYKYKTKKLPPNRAALFKLFFSLLTFGLVLAFLVFNFSLLKFSDVPQKINSLDEARTILQEHNTIINNLKFIIYFFFICLVGDLLPAIYNFAKAVTPLENEKVLNMDFEKKHIFGLNNK